MVEPETHLLGRDAAVAFLRKHRRRRIIFITARVSLPTTPGRCFNTISNVPVSARIAERFILDALSSVLEGRGARIELRLYDTSLFVG